MSFKIEYASRRGEVWTWYWRAWCQRLWKTHLAIFLAVNLSVSIALFSGPPTSLSSLAIVAVSGLLAIAWMPLFPMLMFKPEGRTLSINHTGIETAIGKKSAKCEWKDIKSVSEESGYIVLLCRNGNAFIVPPRAFDSQSAQDKFVSFAKNALQLSNVNVLEPPTGGV
jgi:hypothetical protein